MEFIKNLTLIRHNHTQVHECKNSRVNSTQELSYFQRHLISFKFQSLLKARCPGDDRSTSADQVKV